MQFYVTNVVLYDAHCCLYDRYYYLCCINIFITDTRCKFLKCNFLLKRWAAYVGMSLKSFLFCRLRDSRLFLRIAFGFLSDGALRMSSLKNNHYMGLVNNEII